MTERTGHCLCGAVRFTLAAEPLVTRVCWCRDCQHLAANGTVNLLMAADAVRSDGVLAEHTKPADSGNPIRRQFCPQCGTHLFSRSDARPQFCVVRAGNLDEPSSIRPEMNIWTRSAPSWACLDATLAQSEGQAPPPAAPKP